MSATAKSRFKFKSWDEQPYSEVEGAPKLSRALVVNTFTGDIEGEGVLEYILIYRDDGTCVYTGAERVVGRIGGRQGSFVLQHTGVWENGVAKTTMSVVPGAGGGQLRGLRGTGSFGGSHADVETGTAFTLDYSFED